MEQKFTTMAQEAVGDAIQSASAAGNAQVETLHVMDALLRQENGVARSLIEAAGGDPQAIGAAAVSYTHLALGVIIDRLFLFVGELGNIGFFELVVRVEIIVGRMILHLSLIHI